MTATIDYLAQFDLSGRVAVVTGGSEGIGLGIAEGLGQGGARVVVAARTEAKVAAAEAALTAAGIEALGVPTDVRDEASVAQLFEGVEKRFGRLDILVNSAGGAFGDSFQMGPLLSLTPVDFTESYRSNVIGAVLCSLAAVPIMNRDGGGSIIHISSGAGRRATSELRWACGVSRSA